MLENSVFPSLNLKVEMIARGRRNRPGNLIRPTHITIHNTDNTGRTANANAHSRFVRETGFYCRGGGSTCPNNRKIWVSWHCTVDDTVAIKHLPFNELAFHAKSGNSKSIGIEICMNQGIHQATANQRAAELTATLMHDFGIGIENVVPHFFWTEKACPSLLMTSGKPKEKWTTFLDLVESTKASIPAGQGRIVAEPTEARELTPEEATPIEGADEEEIEHGFVAEQVNLLSQ